MVTQILVLAGSYFLGAIPFGLLFASLWGVDPRKAGSKNIGATNVLRTAGTIPAILTLIFDISKGGIAVLIGKILGISPPWIAGLAAILGHNFPVYLNFKGGKGVATTIGTMVVLYPLGGISVIAIWLLVAAITRYSSLASLISLGLSPLIFTLLSKSDMIGFAVLVAGLAFMRHKDNIKRLLRGTEKKIGQKALLFGLSILLLLVSPQIMEEVIAEEGPVLVGSNTAVPSWESIMEEALEKGLDFPQEAILFFLSKDQSPSLSINSGSPLITFKKAEEAFRDGIKEALLSGIPYLIETLIRIPLKILLIHELTEKRIIASYLILLIACAIGGLPYFIGSVFLLVTIHNPSRTKKAFLILYLVFILLLPFIIRLQQGLMMILSDEETRAIIAVNERKDNRLILSLKGSGSEIFKALLRSPDYRVRGDLLGAEQYYQKAIEIKKNPQTLFNLSQLYKERLDFEKGKNYYEGLLQVSK